MIVNSRSLLLKIHDLLDGKADEELAPSVASEYEAYCSQLNSRIKHFSKLIREGNYYAALDIARIEPSLTKQIERIRFPREQEWFRYLDRLGIACFDGFNDSELKRVKEICADSSNKQPAGYRDYRAAMLKKDKPSAIRALRQLYDDHPKDLNAKQELMRLEQEAFEQIDSELGKLLQQNNDPAIIEKIGATLKDDWIIELSSENWEKAFPIYRADALKKELANVDQTIAQVKVIQRVGNWEDARPLILKFRSINESDLKAELSEAQSKEIRQLLQWFQNKATQQQKELQLIEEFNAFVEQLEPGHLSRGLKLLNRKETKLYKTKLEKDWEYFRAALPEKTEHSSEAYARAKSIINDYIGHRKNRRRKQAVWIWALAPVVVLAVVVAYFIRQEEKAIASDVLLAFEGGELKGVQTELDRWDAFGEQYLGIPRFLRNRRVNQQVEDTRKHLREIETRSAKIESLLNQIEKTVATEMDLSALRRASLSVSTIEDLLELLPETERSKHFDRFAGLKEQIDGIRDSKIGALRESISVDLARIRRLIESYFPWDKKDFSNVDAEVSSVKEAIKTLQQTFRRSFEIDLISDLKAEMESLQSDLADHEMAALDIQQISGKLSDSISLSEYLRYLGTLAKNPFSMHPTVRSAKFLKAHFEKFDSLAQQLLIPSNPLGWARFVKTMEEPLYPTTKNKDEAFAWNRLLGNAVLKDIYQYRVKRYIDGAELDGNRFIYVYQEPEVTIEKSQTSGRLVQVVRLFDESLLGTAVPFADKIYYCETDGNGDPANGDIVVLERLTPESGFYRLLEDLAGYNEAQGFSEKPLLQVMDIVRTDEFIDPLFKAYVLQELLNIMVIRAYDWGLNFCPTAQLDFKALNEIKGKLFPFDWMRNSAKERLSQRLFTHFQNSSKDPYFNVARASRELFKQIADQRVRFGGFVAPDGPPNLLRSTPNDRKLFALGGDGEIVLVRDVVGQDEPPEWFAAADYSPILFFNDPPDAILDRVTRKTGLDVRSESFRPFLPEIFQ